MAQAENAKKLDYTPVTYDDQYILMVNQLKKYFPIKGGLMSQTVGHVKAVDGVTFNLKRGHTMGLVGESGCGKSTTGRTILRLAGEKTGGQVLFNGKEVYDMTGRELRNLRTKMQIIFQDPFSSLSPRLPVGEIIGEAVREHNLVPKAEFNDYIDQVMDNCGLQPYHKTRYPHEFSGGQRQRICIARALALNPEFVVCDEPVSALDVSIQAQIINLLKELQDKYNLTYLFISHDLSVVEHISDTVGVMYLGNLVEYGATPDIFSHPLHPYTKALFSAIPIPDPTIRRERIVLQGSIPSPANPPKGCKFHTRCPYATERCKTEVPQQREVEPGHYVVCHLYEKMKHNEPFEDDGRTVADMSGIEHDSIWLPRRRKQGHTPAQQPQQAADRPWEEDPQLTGKERLWAILGALKATLLICGVYLLGLLALLALLFTLWH